MKARNPVGITILIAAFLPCFTALSHCDRLDGPVVQAAQKALANQNLNLVLIWVRPQDEPEVRRAFDKSLAVRKLNAEARELADSYFFETVVRVHRAGEGAPYTGLKPAGPDLDPAVLAADKALDSGSIDSLVTMLSQALDHKLRMHFRKASVRKEFDANDVAAGRHFVKAYVEFIHYVEHLHQAVQGATESPEAESHSSHKAEHENSH